MSTLYVNNIEPVSGSALTLISASLISVDNLTVTSLTSSFKGNLQGTASFATTASHALNTTPPSGVAGAIQFSNGSAFASDASNLFWDDTNNRLGVGTNAPSTTVDILPLTQTATASQFDCFRVGYSNSTIGVTNFPAFQVQVATTGTSRFSTTLRLSGGSDTSQAYLKGFASNNFGVMLNRTNSNLGLFSDNGIKLGDTVFAGQEGAASAMVHIKGSGSTSATTSLLVQNSGGTLSFKVDDGGNATIGSTNGTIIFNQGYNNVFSQNQLSFYSAATNIRGMFAGGQGLIISKNTGTTDLYPTAILAIDSTTQGFLPPRMTTTQRDAIATPATGLNVYNTTTNTTDTYDGTTWQRFGQQTLIKGSGTTSATTSLLVQNSAGNNALQVTDDQMVRGYSGTSLRFRLGTTTVGQGVSTREGEFAVGFIDTNQSSCLRLFVASSTAFSYIDGYTEGASKAQNYAIVFGSRANNTGQVITGTTTQENGSPVVFGSAVVDASALVQINSTTRGFLPPRMTTTQKNAIATPAAGLMVYDTTLNQMSYFNSSSWVNF